MGWTKRSCLVLFAILACIAISGCATVNVPMPALVPTTQQEAEIIEDGYKLCYTLYLAGSIRESEWMGVKKAYDGYRDALIELKTQHEKAKAGEQIDLTPFSNKVAKALSDFWLKQSMAVGGDTGVSDNGSE